VLHSVSLLYADLSDSTGIHNSLKVYAADMTENRALMYAVLVILVILFAVGFYVFCGMIIGWSCGFAGDGLAAC